MPTCFDCDLIVPTVIALHTHLKVSHNLPNDGRYDCRCAEGDGSFSSFSSWRAYRSHLITRHKCPQVSNISAVTHAKENSEPATCLDNFLGDVQIEASSSETNDCESNENFNIDDVLEDTVLEFTAKLFANHKLPRSSVCEILRDTSNVLTSMLDIVKPALKKILKKSCDEDTLPGLEKLLDSLHKPFRKFSSEYMYLKTLKAKDHLLSKRTVTVGARVNEVMHEGEMVKKLTDVTAKFIPMRIVLQKIFSLPGVFSSVNGYVTKLLSEVNLLENFVQGKLWRRKVQNHFKGKIVFPLFIYFDDFEVNNVLGSHAGVQKLGAVYYSIPCFPPQVQSLLDNIFLAGLFHSSDRVEFTNLNIFKNVIDEINHLQSEGIVIVTPNGPVKIHFALGLVLGDNLGLNQILGFQEGFNAIYPCRFCKTSKYEMQWETTQARVRTQEMYESDVAQGNAKTTGVKERSVWDKVEFFNTCENYAVDFLHDGPEGALKKFMALIVHYFSFTLKCTADNFLSILNDRLNLFNCYHNGIRNRPPPISHAEANEKHIKMSASEMQTFIFIFAMLVGDIVPLDSDVWQFYIAIRRVVDIVLARRLQKDCVALLKSYIGELYEMYLKVFPDETVTFKLHNYLHYALVYDESGPLANLSTYRFESKHKVKKTEANATSSRKDITGTLCHKELLCLAYRFILGKGFAPNDRFGKETKIKLNNLPGYPFWKGMCPASFTNASKKLNWVQIGGQIYRKGSCIVTCVEGTDEVLPAFAVIESVLKNTDCDVLFVCKSLFNSGFVHNLHAYEVEFLNSYECVLANELATPFPAILNRLSGISYVTLRHAL